MTAHRRHRKPFWLQNRGCPRFLGVLWREVAYFRLEIPEDFKLDASLFVGGDCHETFQPEFWLMSADLPEGAPLAPEGYGARQIMSEWQPYQGHGLSGREGPEVREVLSAGVIYLAVVAPDVGGYYLVSLGGREAFGGSAEGREAIPKFNFCG